MDFMGFFWVASLLSSHASTTLPWEKLEDTASIAIQANEPRNQSEPSEATAKSLDPFVASLSDALPPSFDWDIWAAVPEVAVVPISETAAGYVPPNSCFPEPRISEQPRYQVWLHDSLVGETTQSETANHIAHQLRRLLGADDFSPQEVQPLIGEDYAAVGVNQDVLFVIDEGFGLEPEQQKLAALYWTNNLRQAFDLPPVDLASAQMAALGMTATSQQFAGTASWYGPYFHGRITATGETFNQHHLTAAHPSLPFGTYLKVRNQLNGKTVVVRVNDRGPYIGDRSLDLSYAAAQCLGSEIVGVIPYEATILESGVPQQWLAQAP